jgi:HPt (histidine-containing phosphotransfer) domain-containing protein
MDNIRDLAEQHILESTSRLRHIDELMARARSASSKEATAGQTEALLRQIDSDRNRLAQELEEIRRLPRDDKSDVVKRAEGLKGMLESIGAQAEQVIAAIFERDK